MNCRICGNPIVSDGKFCSKCGAPIQETKQCLDCGKSIEFDACFCPYCGSKCFDNHVKQQPSMTESDEVAVSSDQAISETESKPTAEEKRQRIAKINEKAIPTILFSTIVFIFVCSLFVGPALIMDMPLAGRVTISEVNIFSIFTSELEGYMSIIKESTALEMPMRVVYSTEVVCILISVIVCFISAIIATVKFVGFIKYGKQFDFYKQAKKSFITLLACLAVLMLVNLVTETVLDIDFDTLYLKIGISNGSIICIVVTACAFLTVFILEQLANPHFKKYVGNTVVRAISFAVSLAVVIVISKNFMYITQYFSSYSGWKTGNYSAFGFWFATIQDPSMGAISHLAFISSLLIIIATALGMVFVMKQVFGFFESREISGMTLLFNGLTFLALLGATLIAVFMINTSTFKTVIEIKGEGWANLTGVIVPTALSFALFVANTVLLIVRRKKRKTI